MDTNKKHQFEINDLIDEAVNNAVARRNDAVENLSDEEAKKVTGGAALDIKPTILGRIFPPIIIGLIAVDPVKF